MSTIENNTTSTDLQTQALDALARIDAGEVRFVHSDVRMKTMRLLSSNRDQRIEEGLQKYQLAVAFTYAQTVWQELVVAGVPFKLKTKIVEGLKDHNPEKRAAAEAELVELRKEIAENAAKAGSMLAEIADIVADDNFMSTVTQPLHGKALKAAELSPSDLVWVHKTLTSLEGKFYGGAPVAHTPKGHGSKGKKRTTPTKAKVTPVRTPASRGELSWEEKQESFPTGPANPQGGVNTRGVAVPHAGLSHKEKANKGIKK